MDRNQFFVEYSPSVTYDSTCKYKVATGSSNRIANPEVTVRMLSVMDDIFPNGNHRSTLNSWLGSETLKIRGKSVCEHIYKYQKTSIKSKSAIGLKAKLENLPIDSLSLSPHDSFSR
jgi:hypothetical protein